jgi:hypothetical protein
MTTVLLQGLLKGDAHDNIHPSSYLISLVIMIMGLKLWLTHATD